MATNGRVAAARVGVARLVEHASIQAGPRLAVAGAGARHAALDGAGEPLAAVGEEREEERVLAVEVAVERLVGEPGLADDVGDLGVDAVVAAA